MSRRSKSATVKRGAKPMNSLKDIERAIDALEPQELAELHSWLNRHHPVSTVESNTVSMEQGLGLFGSPEDAALLDEVVQLADEERRRPARPSPTL
jgi:hypothetical protein